MLKDKRQQKLIVRAVITYILYKWIYPGQFVKASRAPSRFKQKRKRHISNVKVNRHVFITDIDESLPVADFLCWLRSALCH